MAKYIFITGGVVSSLGKGITAASIGQLLKSRGYRVSMQKFDPYLNVDPGTMSPFQHGEVFVTDDGAETDLDLGHYERFIDEPLNMYASVSAGKIYKEVMEKERLGLYQGHTVQVIPHITNAIKDKLVKVAEKSKADIVITEIGGTVGDIESLPFLEAIRQARRDFGYKNTIYIHNTLVPYLKAAGEIKTKPTQHSVKELRSLGIHPDMIVTRSDVDIPLEVKEKIALFCDVEIKNIYEAKDVEILYEVILNLEKQNIDDNILDHFRYEELRPANTNMWRELINRISKIDLSITVGLIGKYTSMKDAYLSISESLKHSGYLYNHNVNIKWIDSEDVTDKNIKDLVSDCNAVIIPSGFGKRGSEGIIEAIKYLKKTKIPTFAIGYGMQLMLLEEFRNELDFPQASTAELNADAKIKIFDLTDRKTKSLFKSDIKLGIHEIEILKGSRLEAIYKEPNIKERHRNRYEFNKEYLDNIYKSNYKISAIDKLTKDIEAIEYVKHPWFIGVIYHPEFKSRPLKTHSLINNFILAAINNK